MIEHVTTYTTIIEKDTRTGSQQLCYTAYVPILGLATEADTLEGAQSEVKELIQFHLQSLIEEGQEIPIESADSVIAKSQVVLPSKELMAS